MAVNPEKFYNGDGSTTLFPFTFEYLEESDVKVSIDGVVKTQTTDYTFANATTISFNTAPATGTDNVRIYRDTNVDSLKATFFPGSAIRADDLNDNLTQNNYAVQEIKAYTWDNETDTIHSNETWASNDTQIATTQAMDQRFWDQDTDTIQSNETWQDSDSYIPTAAAVDSFVDTVIENDVLVDSTGLTKTTSGGQVTLGIGANSVDFDRIKNDDIITQAEQDASSVNPADTNIFTASAAARRFDTLVQTGTPSGSAWETGKTWYQNDEDKTVYVWDGNSWEAITSGGAFTRLDQVIYVDATNGDDNNNGHRISTPKKTIKSALAAINSDATYGDGSTILVAPGVYKETAPLDIQKKDVAIIGASVRNVIVHPTQATETNSLFRVNSGSYLQNMTFTGVKASGTRGGSGSLWTDSTYGLPPTQGWNVSFYPNAKIYKSPYIQNCTNFSDSEIDNDALNFYAGTEDKGRAGDLDSAPTGGGLLVNGATVHADSPLRSMVADSYTHVGLDGPGIFVTNNGYCQVTSSYAFFNHFHIACLNGGQANLAASTSDFGRYSLIADGRSTSAIFTANTTAFASSGATTFTIGSPTAGTGWHGSATRPQDNMLVDIGGNTYPVLSAVANGSGWDVTISRPDTGDRTRNLGLNGAVSSGSAVSFFLRSMVASSGHTMEYVGSGTNYSALPENGGVPVDANQVVERNNGKVWAAITDHNGTFKVGDTFEVNQQTGFVNIPAGALSVSKLLADLDVNGKSIVTNTTNEDIVLNPNGTGVVNVSTSRITNVVNPTGAQDAATKNYVDNFVAQTANIGNLQVTGAKIANDTIDSSKLTGATVVTQSEQGSATANDTSFFTTAAADARYFNISSGDTIKDGQAFPDNDTTIATTAAINDRIIDLVEEVGGFVPIANETSFPTANPDVNNGTGTIVSIGVIGTSRTPSSGTVTIANGAGSGNTVTITGCGTTVLAAGFGCLVETTSTLHTYAFHRLTPKATEVTTVAGISSDVTTVSGISSNVTTVAGISSDVTTVANNNSNVTAVAGKATEIGRLGTADAVADMAILGTTDVVADMNLLATTDVVSDMNTLATSANVSNMDTCADNITNVNTVAGSIANVNTTAGSISNVNTVATNIASVNNFANVYRIAASDPTTSLDTGDLVFNTTSNELRVYNGSSWQGGVTATGNLVSKSGDTMTGPLGVTAGTASLPSLFVSGDPNTGIYSPGADQVAISTGGTGRLFVDASGRVGVGTSSPAQQCDIRTTSNDDSIPQLLISDAGNNGAITFGAHATYRGQVAYDRPTESLIFREKGNERFRIDSGGRLLVGTSTNLSASTNRYLQVSNSNPFVIFHHNGNNPVADTTLAGLEYGGQAGGSYVAGAFIRAQTDGAWAAGDAPTRLSFSVTADNASSPTERMRIDSSGRVGIGTTTPDSSSLLDVNGVINLTDDNAIAWGGSTNRPAWSGSRASNYLRAFVAGSERLRIDSSGRVGIGTSSPSNLLHIAGTGTDLTGLRIVNTQHQAAATSTAGLKFGITNSAGQRNCRIQAREEAVDSNAIALDFFTNGADAVDGETVKMTVLSSGNVGIGTTSPAADLHVNAASGDVTGRWSSTGNTVVTHLAGTSDTAALMFGDSDDADIGQIRYENSSDSMGFVVNNSTRLVISSAGTLGIGTSSPAATSRIHIATTPADATSPVAIRVGNNGSGSGTGASISLGAVNGAVSTAANIAGFYDGTGTALSFSTSDSFAVNAFTERARIDSSGRFGIGTTSPSSFVDIRGNNPAIEFDHTGTNSQRTFLQQNDGTLRIRQDPDNSGASSAITFEIDASERARITNAGLFQFNSGYGSVATAYGVRAWARWNMQGTQSIYNSGGVSSLTDGGTGQTYVNFTTSMPDANYASAGSRQYRGNFDFEGNTASAAHAYSSEDGGPLYDTSQASAIFVR